MPNVSSVDWRALDDIVAVHGPAPDKDKVTLHSIFKDEIFFCAAFFDHYRKIGVEQFIIFDDGSTDGTREFLSAQDDCVVLTSQFSFEDIVCWEAQPNFWIETRFKIFLLSAIPRFFLGEAYSLHVDADEFLLLPPGLPSVGHLMVDLSESGVNALLASLVDFYPAKYADLRNKRDFSVASAMFAAHPFFDARPIVDVTATGVPRPLRASKMRNEIVKAGLSLERGVYKRFLERWRRAARPNQLSYKTPILRHGESVYYKNAHATNVPAPRNRLLAVVHFVFTYNSLGKARRIVRARRRKGRANRYQKVADTLMSGVNKEKDLVSSCSTKFESARQLQELGVMRWPSGSKA